MNLDKNDNSLIRKRRTIAILGLIVMNPVTIAALWSHGLLGIFAEAFRTWGSRQIFLDLVVGSLLAILWMRQDSRRSGRLFWPWAVLTLAAGSFGPLLYLLSGKVDPTQQA